MSDGKTSLTIGAHLFPSPTPVTLSDNTTTIGNHRAHTRSDTVDPMPEGTSSTGAASTDARTRTPSPPKVTKFPTLASAIPSSSLLAPPSLSFTGPTPLPSPISPPRPSHHKAATDPHTSILRVPATPPVIRQSLSSSSGKRKADEADVEGGGTPPKDSNQARATFAITPRRESVERIRMN